MRNDLSHQDRSVPVRALALSLIALAVPVVGSLAFPRWLGDAGALLWLLALVPAFLLAYYRGWRGVATALAAGMAVLSATQVAVTLLARDVPDLLFWVVVAYLAIAVGIGWVTELLHRERAAVESLALTDILTHLPNRRHARAFLQSEFGAAERGRALCVVLFDLDGFKDYNDRLGHQTGDEALREFAKILQATTRRMNLSSRFGGEEFLSILAGSELEGALIFAERVRGGLASAHLPNGPLTVSAGVAAYHPSMRSPDELIAAADLALYRAKRDGKDCVRIFGRQRDTLLEDPDLDLGEEAGSGEDAQPGYPRPDAAIGRSPPPDSLLPQKPGGFGEGRRILVVDDEPQVRALVASYLNGEGFAVTEKEDAVEGAKVLTREFDVVLTDIRFPGPSGHELVARVKARWPATQVIAITGVRDAHVAAQALKAGADGYLFKPFGMPDLQSQLTDCLARRDRILAERSDRWQPSEGGDVRASEGRETALAGMRTLVQAVELRDPYTRGHSARVAEYTLALADSMGLDPARVNRDDLRLACELHDVGKIEVPEAILNKRDALTTEEFQEVQKHPATGRRMLEPILENDLVLAVIGWHHERWDGGGYPDRLAGGVIPLPARLVALTDALEAMTSERSYRPSFSWDEAVRQIRERAGTHFDPGLMQPFEKALPALRRIHDQAKEEAATARRPSSP